jgi:hypothetical protein
MAAGQRKRGVALTAVEKESDRKGAFNHSIIGDL